MMKHTTVKTILIIALSGLIISCKKQGEQKSVFFPEILYFTQLTQKTEVRLFTKTGEIKDADIIARFIKNVPNFMPQNLPIEPNPRMMFNSKSNAVFEDTKKNYDLNSAFAATKTEFIFYSVLQNAVNPEDLAYKILKFKAPLKTVGKSPNQTFTSQDVRSANGNYLELNFSYLSYKIKQGVGLNQIIKTGSTYNEPVEFNTAALAQLQTTDTIAVQEYIVNYKAQ